MYRKIYRQEGGLAEEGYRAQIREASRKKIEDFNRSNRGEVAQRQGERTPWFSSDAIKNLYTIPQTFMKAFRGSDTIERTPEMDKQLLDIIRSKVESGKGDRFSGTISYKDFGFPSIYQGGPAKFPTSIEELKNLKDAGPEALANALQLGRIGYNIDPSGRISLSSSEYDFPKGYLVPRQLIETGGLKGLWERMRSRITGKEVDPTTQQKRVIQPKDLYYEPREAEKRRLEQVDEYGGLADLPEAQTEQPFESDINIQQPTGFEGTGYGQFSPQPAGGVYTPTGDPGLRPAGTTPTNINTRPYQPLAAY